MDEWKGNYRSEQCGDRTKPKDELSGPLYFSFSHLSLCEPWVWKDFVQGTWKMSPLKECLSLLIFLLPEELSGLLWRKRRRKRMKTKMTRRGEEEKGKPPCGYLCIEVLKPVQLGAAFRWEGRLIAKYKNGMGHQGEKAQCTQISPKCQCREFSISPAGRRNHTPFN